MTGLTAVEVMQRRDLIPAVKYCCASITTVNTVTVVTELFWILRFVIGTYFNGMGDVDMAFIAA